MGETEVGERTLTMTVPDADGTAAEVPRRLGRFELRKLLGAGGMGMVFAADDTLLGRRVAVKVVRAEVAGSGEQQARLLREARALAQLGHENVVTLFDASIEGEAVFIAMELVDGTTLGRWMTTPRPWREVVVVFTAAGRGLAAAHATGLVHRDFKPSNVLVDGAGRVKVSDFGLAASAIHATSGEVAGTPSYMAPEQRRGEAVDERSDQYAFCVSLREALGDRPAPSRLRAIAERGTAASPDDRYPSMTALLDDLEAVLGRRRRRIAIGISAAGAAAAGVLVAAMAGRPAGDPCEGAAGRLSGIWDEARRATVEASLRAADPAQGAARFAAAAAVLDRHAAAWATMHVAACRANRVTGSESDTLFDRRIGCLDRRLAELRGTTDALAGAADPTAIDAAVIAARQLGGLDACADADALLALIPPPEQPAARRAVDAAQAEIDALEVAVRRGAMDGLADRAAPVVDHARATGHAPTVAAALRVQARILINTDAHAAAAVALRELTEVAATAHDDDAAAWAWIELLTAIGWQEGKRDEALALLPAARAAVKRASGDLALEAGFLKGEATVLQLAGRGDEARTRIGEARALLERGGAREPGSPLAGRLADVVYDAAAYDQLRGRYADASRGFREAIDASTAAYGADHPETATAWHALGEAYRWGGRQQESLAAYREALRIRGARLGESPAVANTLIAVAATYQNLGRLDEALAGLERAQRILRTTKGASRADLASAIMTIAAIHQAAKRSAEAQRRFDEAIALYEALPGEHANLGVALYNRGEERAATGRCEQAIDDYRRALGLFESVLGDRHANLVFPLAAMGRCQILLGHHAAGIATLDRALAIPGEGVEPSRLQARLYRGRALVESGRDRAGGLREVHAVRDEAARIGATAETAEGEIAAALRRDAVQWLAARGER